MIARSFRTAGEPPPAKPPKFPHKPPANSPPTRRPSKDVLRATADPEVREGGA